MTAIDTNDQDTTEMTYYEQLSQKMLQAGPHESVQYEFKDKDISEIVLGLSAAEANIFIAAIEYATMQVKDSGIPVFDDDQDENDLQSKYAEGLAQKLTYAVSRT